MKAAKTVFLCSNCGNETPRWQGRCPSCGQWNTLEEYTPPQAAAPSRSSLSNRTSAARGAGVQPKRLNEVTSGEELRFGTGLSELDRVLGGGRPSPAGGRLRTGPSSSGCGRRPRARPRP